MSGHLTPTVEISLPQEQQSPLPEQERSHILDAHSGETLLEHATKAETGQHLLVALDPEAKQGQSDVAVQAALRIAKPGDTVVLFSAMSPVAIMDPGAYSAFSISYDMDWQLSALRELRKERISELTKIAKTFPKDVKVLVHVVHGGTERKILAAAEQHHADLIILGRRKLGRLEKLLTTSVSNWIVSHAPCAVLVAKSDKT